MNLIVSDRSLEGVQKSFRKMEWIDLSKMKIANCVGCFGCWTKTPGRCVIRDDAVNIYPRMAAADRVMYISRVRYGGFDTVMKTMLERAIPVQQAFIRLHHGQTHHIQRCVPPKQAVVIGYGNLSQEEKEIFQRLVARNADNMNFESYRVVFATEEDLEQTVGNEVRIWEKS